MAYYNDLGPLSYSEHPLISVSLAHVYAYTSDIIYS